MAKEDNDERGESELSAGVAGDGAKIAIRERGRGLWSRVFGAAFPKAEARARIDGAMAEVLAKKLADNEPLTDTERFFFIQAYGKELRRQSVSYDVLETAKRVLPEVEAKLRSLPPAEGAVTSERWVMRVERDIEDATDHELRELYGRIIAGEIVRPGSFSLRTLTIVRDLETETARLFEKAARYVLSEIGLVPVHALHRNEVTSLVEAGLMNSQQVDFAPGKRVHDDGSVEYYALCGDIVAAVRAEAEPEKPIALKGFQLTAAGRELLVIPDLAIDEKVLRMWAAQLNYQLTGWAFIGELWQDIRPMLRDGASAGVRSWWFHVNSPDDYHEFDPVIGNVPPDEFTYHPSRKKSGKR